jgi:uncharacterized protein YutE (UPF0331/DUF86 family)
MAFDRAVIQARITTIETNLDRLALIPQATFDEFVADFRNIEATKHLLQTAIEAMIDICSHAVSRLRLQVPGNGVQLVQVLADAGWLPMERVLTYARMIRFRNLIVHLYAEVDDSYLYDILRNRLDDFRLFIADTWHMVQRDEASGSGEGAQD